ncbi:DUF1648 domain-containing protein [Planomonospora sp. ID91781]|uniref:hypothetical protein n=1 Tax=Planomonospora sp. ID91781 TaxID=2738135 RepID=UPI0018C37E19|nr:hypothetical protein [Planomonospora sp. ID91781]MBG0821897.1 DUF1648 domain-containing protein [Planomonospora sp. ID91781]
MTDSARRPSTSAPPGGRASSRGFAVAVAAVWGALVTAALVTVPLALRDRLPEPMAVHWSGGSVPDRSMPFAGDLATGLALWGVAWVFLLGAALHGAALRGRPTRVQWWGFLFGWAVFALGVQGATLLANLDAGDWRRALLPGWTVLAVLGAAVAVGVLAGWLGRGGPDRAPDPEAKAPSLRLRPGRRAVWVSRTSNPWLLALSGVALTGSAGAAVLAAAGVLDGSAAWTAAAATALAALLGLATATIQVRVDADGLRVGFGPLARPAYRVPAGAIESARAERATPGQVGGWGLRGVPGTGRTTLMLRGGEHLVIRRTTGGEFAVSADDAERGAALLNAYTAESDALRP